MEKFYSINKEMQGMSVDHVIQEYLQTYENMQNLGRRASKVENIKQNIPKLSIQRIKTNRILNRIYTDLESYDQKMNSLARELEEERGTLVESLFSNVPEYNRGFYSF